LAVATVVLLTVMTILMLAHAALYQLTMLELGTFDATGAEARLALFRLIRWSATVAHLATAALFLMWVYRATANLPALGAPSTRFTPAGAVKVFFIPFVNLVRAYQVLAMIWTESQPRTLTDAGHLKPRSIVIVIVWYALGLGAVLVDAMVSVRSVTVGVGVVPEMVSFVLTAAAAILCAIMVYKADARQRAQAEDLERRANLPLPTGTELR
jgi:Domain of unknown function (DUF4328)